MSANRGNISLASGPLELAGVLYTWPQLSNTVVTEGKKWAEIGFKNWQEAVLYYDFNYKWVVIYFIITVQNCWMSNTCLKLDEIRSLMPAAVMPQWSCWNCSYPRFLYSSLGRDVTLVNHSSVHRERTQVNCKHIFCL